MPYIRVQQRIVDALGHPLTKDDTLIIAGDFGYTWYPEGHHDYPTLEADLDTMNKEEHVTLFLDGNHENFDRLDALPVKSAYRGAVGVLRDKVLHLRRGETYIIEDQKILTIGGGMSVDKNWRKEGSSWWPRENIDWKEVDRALKSVYENKQRFDYIISHTGPRSIVDKFFMSLQPGRKDMKFPGADKMYCATAAFLEELYVKHIKSFKGWFFAHLHMESHKDTNNLYGKRLHFGEPKLDEDSVFPFVSIRNSVLPITFFDQHYEKE